MIRAYILTAFLIAFSAPQALAQSTEGKPQCEELVALFMELGRRSGQPVTREQAVAEVMSENPSDGECGQMLSLFPKQD